MQYPSLSRPITSTWNENGGHPAGPFPREHYPYFRPFETDRDSHFHCSRTPTKFTFDMQLDAIAHVHGVPEKLDKRVADQGDVFEVFLSPFFFTLPSNRNL
jgi:hypothetical protein